MEFRKWLTKPLTARRLKLAMVEIFYFPQDDPIGKSLAMYGEWAEPEIEFLSTFIGLGSAIIDVGAYLGTHTLAFSRRVGPGGSYEHSSRSAPFSSFLSGLSLITAAPTSLPSGLALAVLPVRCSFHRRLHGPRQCGRCSVNSTRALQCRP